MSEDTVRAHNESVELYRKSRALEERQLVTSTMCAGCRFGVVFRRKNQLNVHVNCLQFGPVPSDIVECSRYIEHNTMDMREMEMLALPVDGRVGIRDGSYR